MKRLCVLLLCVTLSLFTSGAEGQVSATYVSEVSGRSLGDVIQFALEHNPALRISKKEIERGAVGIDGAKAEMFPKIDFETGAVRSKYYMPLTPIEGLPSPSTPFPDFENPVYNFGFVLSVPLYKGGRLVRQVAIARLKKSIAEEQFVYTRQDLAYNITSLYFKILQLNGLRKVTEAQVRSLEAHRRQVELFLKAGKVARAELLKTDVALAGAKENRLLVVNNMDTSYELLKRLMGFDDASGQLTLLDKPEFDETYPGVEEGLRRALEQRPDYRAVLKRKQVAEEHVKVAEGRRLPSVFMAGDYVRKAGDAFSFKEDWRVALRLSLPVFDGGVITADIQTQKIELDKTKEEERALRLEITRDVRDSTTRIENARERMDVSGTAIESARENARVEELRFQSGASTTTDVLDAQTALLRSEIDYQQALFDKSTAIASLRRAIGEEGSGKGASK